MGHGDGLHHSLEGYIVFDFLKGTRDKATRADSPVDDFQSTQQPESRPPGASEPAVSNRELLRIVLRDTLRKNGIPTDWIASQITSRTQAGLPTAHQIQLVILKWHEGLLRFAPLLQHQVLKNLHEFDPQVNPDSLSVVWSFAPNCGCPYTTLPAPTYWSAATERQKFDLPPSSRKFHEIDDDFATTVPSSLN
jgi:hypothetical protein